MNQPGSPTTNVESRYRLLVDSITDYAIYMLDADGYVSSWNPGAQKFKGYEASEIVGQHFSRFYPEEEQRDGLPQRALRIAADEGRYEHEGWRIRKDGGRFWAHVIIDPIWSPQGEIAGFAKITRDLTERKRAEESLRQSEHQFRLLVQGVTDYAIYLLDPQGIVSSWNAGAQRIKGYASTEIIGRHFSAFYTPEDRTRGLPQRSLDTAIEHGRFEKEGWRLRKDGTRFEAHVVIDAIRNDVGTLLGFAKITRDITERKQAERSLQQAQQALFQTQKLESIGQLTGGIAHDFNNLLAAVLGSLELLRKRLPDDEQARRLLDNAVDGAERGSILTQRMLAFARRQELKLEAVDIPALITGIMGLLERSIGPEIVVTTRFSADLPAVQSDANQLESALLNLAVNARDAMPSGGAMTIKARQETIEAGCAPDLAPGSYVCLSVTDTGMGMDAETLIRATEPFFTTKGIGKGTGLGLSMVHGLAAQIGGALRIASERNLGTTVEIWMPVATTPAKNRAVSQSAAVNESVERFVILLVDDDDLVRKTTSAVLDDLGHIVIEASSGAEAVHKITDHADIDVIMTDYAMPGMNGLQLAQIAKEMRPDLPVILATGYMDISDAGATRVHRLAKPYRRAELIQAISKSVGKRL